MVDPNYFLDDKGKAHFLFDSKTGEKVVRQHLKKECSVVVRRTNKKRNYSESEESSDFEGSVSVLEFREKENPLPGFIDPITLEEVVKPAISPHGHVMGYDSWVQCLTRGETRNICPLTKKTLSKRDLVILTWDNIDNHRYFLINNVVSEKIINT